MRTNPDSGSVSEDPSRPRRILAAAVLTALEGVIVAGFGLYSLVLLFTDRPDGMTQAVTLAVTVLALSALPLAAARGLWLRRRWSRGPTMIVQLLALPVGWQLAQNGGSSSVLGAAVGIVGIAVLCCVVNPTATEALGAGPRES